MKKKTVYLDTLMVQSVYTTGPMVSVSFRIINPSEIKHKISIHITNGKETKKTFSGLYSKSLVNFYKEFPCENILNFSKVIVTTETSDELQSYESPIKHNILGKSQLILSNVFQHFLFEKNRLFLKIRMHLGNQGEGVNGRCLGKITITDIQRKNIVVEKKFFVDPISIGDSMLMGIKIPINNSNVLGKSVLVKTLLNADNSLEQLKDDRITHQNELTVPQNIFYEQIPTDWIEYSPINIEKYNLLPLSNSFLSNANKLTDYNVLCIDEHQPVSYESIKWNGEQYGRNFQFRLHTLMFIRDLIASHRKTQDIKYIHKTIKIILDWAEQNDRFLNFPSHFSWDNHSVAWRTITLLHVYEYFKIRKFGQVDFINRLEQLLYRHARFLEQEGLLETHSNHGLNQILALFLVAQISKEFYREKWVNISLKNLSALFNTLVYSDGGSKEQSAYYHFYTLKSFQVILDAIRNSGVEAPKNVLEKIHLMYDYAIHLTKPDQTIVRSGDTHSTTNIWGYKFNSLKDYSKETRYVSSNGSKGVPPSETFKIFPETGTVFFRQSWNMGNSPNIFSVFDLGPTGHTSHGHKDAFTFELSIDNTDFIIDSGALNYEPNDIYRKYMLSPHSHNITLINDNRLNNVSPKITEIVEWRDVKFVKGEAMIWPFVYQKRAILFIPNYGIILFDLLFHEKNDNVLFSQNFQLPAKSKINFNHNEVTVEINNQLFSIREYIPNTYSLNIIEGSKNPVRGWVSYFFNDLRPAPMLFWEYTGNVYRSIKSFSKKKSVKSIKIYEVKSNIFMINFSPTEHIYIQLNNRSLNILRNINDQI